MSVLLTERDGGILRLTLNRPDKRNALSPELLQRLVTSLADAHKDESVRCVLLSGAGGAFCAGGDVEAMLARRGDAVATKKAQEEWFAALARGILYMEKPVVAHVNGDAYGAGLMLVLASDYAVASGNARFAASFTKVGLLPDTAGTWLLPHTLGLRHAREMALLAEPVYAKRALELGIVSAVEEDSQGKAEDVARRLADGPTKALGLTKRAIVQASAEAMEGALAREANLQALLFTTWDHGEGVDAFLQKRAPKYAGR